MLKSIAYKDFKRYNKAKLPLSSPLTILVGPNSSGKSSLLKGLLAFKQTYEDPLDHAGFMSHGQYVDIGLFSEYVKDHHINKTATFIFEMSVDNVYFPRISSHSKINTVFISVEQSEDPQTKHGRVETYGLYLFLNYDGQADYADTPYWIRYQRMQKSEERFKPLVSEGLYHAAFSSSSQRSINAPGARSQYERAMQKCLAGQVQCTRDNKRGMLMDFSKPGALDDSTENIFRIERTFVERAHGILVSALTSDLFALAALRSKPSRSFKRTDERRTVGSEGQNTASVFSDLRERAVKAGVRRGRIREDFDRLEEWFRRLKLGDRLDIGSYRDLIDMRMKSKGASSIGESVVDIGVGFSQAAPILVQLAAMPERSVLILEQPELHLYPWTQTRLGQILCEEAKRHGKRLVIETHSEHLIRGIQLHVSESRKETAVGLNASDISIIYVDSEAGLNSLHMDEFGEFTEPWPDGFFDQTISVYRKIIENKIS